MEVYSVLAAHIMLVAWVREVVHLDVVDNAGPDETEAVLPENHRVDRSLADKQLALEVLCLVDEAGLLISLRVHVRMIHLSLAVHHLVPFPVDDRTSGHSDLEYVRIVCDQ